MYTHTYTPLLAKILGEYFSFIFSGTKPNAGKSSTDYLFCSHLPSVSNMTVFYIALTSRNPVVWLTNAKQSLNLMIIQFSQKPIFEIICFRLNK